MYIELGKVVGVWGVKGWIKLHSYGRNRTDIANYPNWWLQKTQSDSPQQYQQLNCRIQGQGVVAQLKSIDYRDQAQALIGQKILVKKEDLPVLADGEYYWHQLIGLTVNNQNGQIGQLSSILETGANDVLVVKRSDQSNDLVDALIPYIKDVVIEVDLEQGTITVDWDPSYLDD